jgi:hypothetical protein
MCCEALEKAIRSKGLARARLYGGLISLEYYCRSFFKVGRISLLAFEHNGLKGKQVRLFG